MDREQAIRLMQDLLRRMVDRKGSDLFITASFPPAIKVDPNGEFLAEQMYVQYVKLAQPRAKSIVGQGPRRDVDRDLR